MPYNADIYHRHSLRLCKYDYSQAGAYFVTVCTHNKECLFGEIQDGVISLNDAGKIVHSVWDKLPISFPGIIPDEFIVMPNHCHGILLFAGAERALPRLNGLPGSSGPAEMPSSKTTRKGAASSAPTLGDVVRTFKSKSAVNVNRFLNRSARPLWQRNYYEHIVRSEDELNIIRDYISQNAARWAVDDENPVKQTV